MPTMSAMRPRTEPVTFQTREQILEAVARHELSADDAAAAIRALGTQSR